MNIIDRGGRSLIQDYREAFANAGLDINNIKYNEPMKDHSSFKVGGPADVFIEPGNVRELKTALQIIKEKEMPWYLIGNGSNLLVSDKGLRGAVIKIGERFSNMEINEEEIIAESGMLLSTLSRIAARNQLTGLEFASGIPGALGGALAMNAGAYGGEMKDVVQWVEALDENLELIRLSNEDMCFGYRKSTAEARGLIILRCSIKLRKGEQEQIDGLMSELAMKRKTKQPLHLPSAGSTFKRPEGYFAGKLIEDSELKGFSVGDAQVSPMHCGFVVNNGNATAQDIYNLIKHVQKTVFDKFNIQLETEVKILGEF